MSGVQAQAWDTNALTTLRKAKTLVRTVGRSMANAYLLNPADLETVDLLQDNEGRFYFGGPGGVGSASVLWGIPVIETEAVPAGTGYVGDFRKAILWDREQASITVTDTHADFFVRNLVADPRRDARRVRCHPAVRVRRGRPHRLIGGLTWRT